jgi:hypothetical protein
MIARVMPLIRPPRERDRFFAPAPRLDEPPAELACAWCGCTDSAACEGGCSWTRLEPPTCSRCERRLRREDRDARLEREAGSLYAGAFREPWPEPPPAAPFNWRSLPTWAYSPNALGF